MMSAETLRMMSATGSISETTSVMTEAAARAMARSSMGPMTNPMATAAKIPAPMIIAVDVDVAAKMAEAPTGPMV